MKRLLSVSSGTAIALPGISQCQARSYALATNNKRVVAEAEFAPGQAKAEAEAEEKDSSSTPLRTANAIKIGRW
jgi:hypothetical protein